LSYSTLTKLGHRSGLEDKIALQLQASNIPYTYEEYTIRYEKPATVHTYRPDFVLPNGIVIETKGRFLTADRKKHLLIADQHPKLDIRFVFSNSRAKIGKKSQTTYAKWCQKHQFLYADKEIPAAWLKEAALPERLKAVKDILKKRGD
jgi:hypothetical protein